MMMVMVMVVMQGTRYLQAFDIRPLDNHNEITHHFLESIFVHLQNTKGRLNQVGRGRPIHLYPP